MTDGLKHTDAFDMEAFLAKPQSAQLLEIWLNTRETDGTIADVVREVSAQGIEIQKARMALSDHIDTHVTPEELKLIRGHGTFAQLLEERKTMKTQVQIMWDTYSTGKRLLIFGGAVLAFFVAIQPVELWLLTKFFG